MSAERQRKEPPAALACRISLLAEPPCLEKAVVDLLSEICQEQASGLDMYLALGQLVGARSRKRIKLPVGSMTLLEPSSEVEFLEEVPSQTLQLLMMELLPEARTSWEVTGGTEVVIVETYHGDNCCVALQRLDAQTLRPVATVPVKLISIAPLGEVTFYFPAVPLHSRLCCLRRRFLTDSVTAKRFATRVTLRRSTTWQFTPRDAQMAFPFRLTYSSSVELGTPPMQATGDVDDALAGSENVEEELDVETLLHPYGPPREWFLEKLEVEEDFVHSVRLSADVAEIVNPPDLDPGSNESGPAFVDRNLLRLTAELLRHARRLASLLGSHAIAPKNSHLGPPGGATYYYPSFLGDVAAEARRHYNRKTILTARASRIEALRRLNNEVKRLLIHLWVPLEVSVLDLACGHAQDILKYSDKRLKRFVGIDISSEEIAEGIRRMESSASALEWMLFEGNLVQETTFERLKGERFDVVSFQLAIHYCLENEATADALLRQVSRHLKVGGVFLGSTGDCDSIANGLIAGVYISNEDCGGSSSNGYTYWYGNDEVFKVKFSEATLSALLPSGRDALVAAAAAVAGEGTGNDALRGTERRRVRLVEHADEAATVVERIRNTWGIPYSFWLTQHIAATEYVVPWDAFCNMALRYGLTLELVERFDKFLGSHIRAADDRRLNEWKRTALSRMRFDGQQAEAFQFYRVFVFRRILLPDDSPSAPRAVSRPSPPTATIAAVQATGSLRGGDGLGGAATFQVGSDGTDAVTALYDAVAAAAAGPPEPAGPLAANLMHRQNSGTPELAASLDGAAAPGATRQGGIFSTPLNASEADRQRTVVVGTEGRPSGASSTRFRRGKSADAANGGGEWHEGPKQQAESQLDAATRGGQPPSSYRQSHHALEQGLVSGDEHETSWTFSGPAGSSNAQRPSPADPIHSHEPLQQAALGHAPAAPSCTQAAPTFEPTGAGSTFALCSPLIPAAVGLPASSTFFDSHQTGAIFDPTGVLSAPGLVFSPGAATASTPLGPAQNVALLSGAQVAFAGANQYVHNQGTPTTVASGPPVQANPSELRELCYSVRAPPQPSKSTTLQGQSDAALQSVGTASFQGTSMSKEDDSSGLRKPHGVAVSALSRPSNLVEATAAGSALERGVTTSGDVVFGSLGDLAHPGSSQQFNEPAPDRNGGSVAPSGAAARNDQPQPPKSEDGAENEEEDDDDEDSGSTDSSSDTSSSDSSGSSDTSSDSSSESQSDGSN